MHLQLWLITVNKIMPNRQFKQSISGMRYANRYYDRNTARKYHFLDVKHGRVVSCDCGRQDCIRPILSKYKRPYFHITQLVRKSNNKPLRFSKIARVYSGRQFYRTRN